MSAACRGAGTGRWRAGGFPGEDGIEGDGAITSHLKGNTVVQRDEPSVKCMSDAYERSVRPLRPPPGALGPGKARRRESASRRRSVRPRLLDKARGDGVPTHREKDQNYPSDAEKGRPVGQRRSISMESTQGTEWNEEMRTWPPHPAVHAGWRGTPIRRHPVVPVRVHLSVVQASLGSPLRPPKASAGGASTRRE